MIRFPFGSSIIETPETPIDLRKKIQTLEDSMMETSSELKISIEPKHYFANGLYAREITIPAGTILTGLIHKEEHINIISKGKILVVTENGPQEITAPATIISKPGTKRAGYAIEETVWTTVHATELTDVSEVEESLVCKSHEEYEKHLELIENKKLLGGT